MIFDREVYQKTKDSLLWECESQHLEKTKRYLPSMLPHLYECDFDEISDGFVILSKFLDVGSIRGSLNTP
jgi:hypothetical protein